MLTTLLFDLDNTLILYDENEFYEGYFTHITDFFADLIAPDRFQQRLIEATLALLQNNGEMPNSRFFMDVFSNDLADGREVLWQRFLTFYDTRFDRLERVVTRPDGLQDTFCRLMRSDLKHVLASNPIFPRNVQLKRLAWAGLAHVPFDLVTHIENMSFCKPRTGYYLEICRRVKAAPENCLMVGNDPVNDMVAARTGMKTYLTLDARQSHIASLTVSEKWRAHQAPEIPEPTFKGPLAGVPAVVERLLADT